MLLLGWAVACSNFPSSPTPSPAPTPHPVVTVTSLSVTGAAGSPGFSYGVVVHLRESAGVVATIAAVDLAFLNGTTTVLTSHHTQPISDTANVCPASGTVDTRELKVVDTDASHPYANRVQVTVTFTDTTSAPGTATGSADVPPLAGPPPPAQTYTMTGVISDQSIHTGIPGARVEVLAGLNAGKAATTDGNGGYVLNDLAADGFRLRASAAGYDPGEQGVSVPANPRADFELRRSTSVPSCNYSVSPTSQNVTALAAYYSARITRTAGDCGWQAKSGADWITFSGASSASADATLGYLVAANSGGERTATITITWSGGSATITVVQASPCQYTMTPGGTVDIPYGGGQFNVSLSRTSGTCTWQAYTYTSWISLTGRTTGGDGDTFPYSAAANPDGAQRTGYIYVYLRAAADNAYLGSITLTVRQAALPPTECFYTVTPAGPIQIPRAGGSYSLTITRTSGTCGWQASATASWITLSATSGSSTATLPYTVSENTSGGGRTAFITVTWPGNSGVQVNVTQSSAFITPSGSR